MKGKPLLLLIAAGICLPAGDDVSRHKKAMDQVQEWKDDLKDALDAKAAAKAAGLADKLAKAAAQEASLWNKAKQDDALKLANENLEESRQIFTRVKAGNFDQALQTYGRLEATCRACHDLHPEKRLIQQR
ncbi:MAG: hypothetical protein JWP63_3815 [Candidatus Solibacter sp.]|jgi:formamidopyrimidine-DNA glycosylase|nr:hypothetical protein [Candidatus Solibacter sp.]